MSATLITAFVLDSNAFDMEPPWSGLRWAKKSMLSLSQFYQFIFHLFEICFHCFRLFANCLNFQHFCIVDACVGMWDFCVPLSPSPHQRDVPPLLPHAPLSGSRL